MTQLPNETEEELDETTQDDDAKPGENENLDEEVREGVEEGTPGEDSNDD